LIGFRELVTFCAYEFFCCGAVVGGEVDSRSLSGAIKYLELPADLVSDTELSVMLKYASTESSAESLHSVKAFGLVFKHINKLVVEGLGDMAPIRT